MSSTEFSAWMRQAQQRVETALDHALPAANVAPARLNEATRYATLGGGKRVRPLLVYAAGELARSPAAALDAAACAVEMIHVYSLVHDDLPCMDDDVLRRGKPTVHIEYDEATAMLVGDGLQALAFQQIGTPGLVADPARQLRMSLQLARAAGPRGMVGGQALDLAAVGQNISLEELEFMHVHKTGALIRAAVLLGALSGDASDSELETLDHFAKTIGLLFQVVDDLLDAEADTATLGKTAGKDAAHNKPTYVSLIGLADAKRFAGELRAEATRCLAPFGDRAQRLAQLTDFIVERSF
ncbi:polyprenyl synthetase family protein [Niveibacterium sp. SC-1]|uniref:polyprenyl synthetase family protein n=1 Tax=Niveibacterium sp. SC-1 TaxID=3135646 RepID=UPI0031203C58